MHKKNELHTHSHVLFTYGLSVMAVKVKKHYIHIFCRLCTTFHSWNTWH